MHEIGPGANFELNGVADAVTAALHELSAASQLPTVAAVPHAPWRCWCLPVTAAAAAD